MRLAAIVAMAALAACGDDARVTVPDSPPADPPPDAPDGFAACAEFATAGVGLPAHVEATLAGSDLASPASCQVMNAPFGAESAGPDRVIPLVGLRTGATYVVKLASDEDLQFYVVTGCNTPAGPGADECLLFEDASLGGAEINTFVATSSRAYIVVDYYASRTPASPAFTLDVYEEECRGADQCGSGAPACFDGLCVQCVSAFDCASPAAPRCDDATHACTAGVDACTAEDARDPSDDGPTGAPTIALDAAGHAVENATICASPSGEADFRAFEVTALGQTWDFQLAWGGQRDLDLEVFDASGTRLGMSFWEQPERVRLRHLALGRYFVRVREFGGSSATGLGYTLTAQRTEGAACATAADCAAEFRNQIFRGSCEAGACVAIDGGGGVPEGGACDSQSDCGLALHCPSFFFVADGDTRETCARGCSSDTECAPLGGDFTCTTYLANNFCVHKCTTDDHCPTVLGAPPQSGPWFRLTCDLPTGRCKP